MSLHQLLSGCISTSMYVLYKYLCLLLSAGRHRDRDTNTDTDPERERQKQRQRQRTDPEASPTKHTVAVLFCGTWRVPILCTQHRRIEAEGDRHRAFQNFAASTHTN